MERETERHKDRETERDGERGVPGKKLEETQEHWQGQAQPRFLARKLQQRPRSGRTGTEVHLGKSFSA